METLLDTISQDIKNPLTSLLLSVEMLPNDTSENSNEFKSIVKMIKSGIGKLHNIINDLTETRRGEQQHKYIAVDELLNLEHIIEDVSLTLLEAKESEAV